MALSSSFILQHVALNVTSMSMNIRYCKVASSRLSWLVSPKENFDAYLLWPLDKIFEHWIVDLSTAHNFTIVNEIINISGRLSLKLHDWLLITIFGSWVLSLSCRLAEWSRPHIWLRSQVHLEFRILTCFPQSCLLIKKCNTQQFWTWNISIEANNFTPE